MGSFSKSISERSKHTRISKGYCLICGQHGPLSWDHVPPKGAVAITKVEQRHITEAIGKNASKIKGVKSTNGSKFRTICHNCNNFHVGGVNDQEVSVVFNSLSTQAKDYFKYANSPQNVISARVNATRFARAMIGHILAATSVEECLKEPAPTPYFSPLQNFVLGDDDALNETHDLYYWFYPYTKHLSAKILTFWHEGNFSTLSILSFFPIAFMVAEKEKAVYPARAERLQLDDNRVYLDLSSKGFEFAEFPFHVLQGNQMLGLVDQMAIISYPIGQ